MESTHPFTCNTCQVAFRSSELQRSHMQTDWHRYNLKRRVASLPPLSSEIFTDKVLANKADAAATAAKATFEKQCSTCQRSYYSENAFQNHIKSQKHRANLARRGKAGTTDQGGDDTGSVVSSTFSLSTAAQSTTGQAVGEPQTSTLDQVVEGMREATLSGTGEGTADSSSGTSAMDSSSTEVKTAKCLFCNYSSPTLSLNVTHMTRFHGMFIPEQDYLVDLEGLVSHLGHKVHELHTCLYCNKAKPTAVGIQTHMRDTGHCMIAFESEEEMIDIGQFYDFRSTYSDADDADSGEEHDADGENPSRATKLGARRARGSGDNEAEDEGWETDSTLSSVPSDEITSVPIPDFSHRYATLAQHRHHCHADPRPHRNLDGWHSHAHPTPHAVYHDDVELHLPSGKSVGHRNMKVYWNQNLRRYPSAAEREGLLLRDGAADDYEDEDDDTVGGADARQERDRRVATRANGNLGMVGVTAAKKREVRKAEQRDRDRQVKAQGRQQWGNERRNNFQRHFRDPLLQ